ncbi:TolC family protein [Pseudorhodoplanes sinuspersici]|uniref:Copper resistance protein n=1 Tax=Pseudorhodoplanes sinuspersici TaxID=1235591 RepID=A0A1W6ZXX5_9HYPH|nr:TolC family protein [Pseudorhodoplanes sinuspersici]ARQ02163.1 copper resistance protein [Pseudorhodoplanes sinuspersici]RKE73973.1 outer membrane protein TolC [Pseudorhodoplanes sinuspersici]
MKSVHTLSPWRKQITCVVLTGLLLSGCKAFSPDGGMDLVASVASQDLQKDVAIIATADQAEQIQSRIDGLLRKPLTADSAVQIALLNNRGLQAAYNALGIAEAEMVSASLPPAPTVSLERLVSPFEREIEWRIIGNIVALVTLPARASIAADRFEQARLQAVEATLRLAAETRRNYYRVVAARQLAAYLDQSKGAAEAATKTARQLGETGAMNKIDQAREQVFYADVTAQLGLARQRMETERERLIRTMGLWGRNLSFILPGTLPALPRKPYAQPTIEMEAVARRVDIQSARIELAALAKTYGLTEASRFVNLLELSGIRKTKQSRSTGEKEISRGFEADLQIPIFDLGETRVRAAEQTYMQAVNRLAEKAVNARSEAREAYRRYRASYDIARHFRDEVVPLRKIISDETLLRYNAMLIDVFDVLIEARQRLAANGQAIEAQRDFWLASVDMHVAITGGGGAGGDAPQSMAAAPSGGSAGH